MEPHADETMSDGLLRRSKKRGSGLMAALAGGLMIVGVVTLALIGTVAFRSFSGPGDQDARGAAVSAPAQNVRPAVNDGAAAVAATVQKAAAPDREALARVAAEKALAESLTRKAALAPAQAANAPPAAAPAPPKPGIVSSVEARAHVARAATMFHEGDVSGARLLLDRAVRGGDPAAAFALAETWDPNVLAALNVRGVRGDKEKARTLYTQALDGGLGEARARIAGLGQ